MKKAILTLLLATSFVFVGCSSKYQTNDLPEDEIVNVPKSLKEPKYYLNSEVKEDFEKYLIDELGKKTNEPTKYSSVEDDTRSLEESALPSSIWSDGYRKDKKRY